MSKFERNSREIWRRQLNDGTYEMYAIYCDNAGGDDQWVVGGGKFKLSDYEEWRRAAVRSYGVDRGLHQEIDEAQAVFEYLFVDDFYCDDEVAWYNTYEEALAWVNERIKED